VPTAGSYFISCSLSGTPGGQPTFDFVQPGTSTLISNAPSFSVPSASSQPATIGTTFIVPLTTQLSFSVKLNAVYGTFTTFNANGNNNACALLTIFRIA
jgi:hypothetical protein